MSLTVFGVLRGIRRSIAFKWMRYQRGIQILKMELELQRSKELLRYGNALLYLISENNMLSSSMCQKGK